MKKVVFVLLVLTGIAKYSNAQNGSLLVYGNVNFASNTDSFAFKSNSYSINPGIGYQFSDHWTAGINIAFGGTKSEIPINSSATTIPSGNYNTTKFFNIGPFLRYTYSFNSIFSLYGQGEFNSISGSTSPYALIGGTYKGYSMDLFPAIGVNIKNGFAINLSFGGIYYQSKTYSGQYYNAQPGNIPPTSSSSQFVVTLGQGATFGISKNFGMKKQKK
jgi:hypothetical protein